MALVKDALFLGKTLVFTGFQALTRIFAAYVKESVESASLARRFREVFFKLAGFTVFFGRIG